jgi:hypothetical protein
VILYLKLSLSKLVLTIIRRSGATASEAIGGGANDTAYDTKVLETPFGAIISQVPIRCCIRNKEHGPICLIYSVSCMTMRDPAGKASELQLIRASNTQGSLFS